LFGDFDTTTFVYMGVRKMEVNAICTVSNPENGKEKDVEFFVDTGSSRTIVTPEVADELGLKTIREEKFTIADKSKIKVKLAVAGIRFEDRETLDIVGVFDVPRQVLGLSSIELLGLYPDTTEGRLKKREFYSMILCSQHGGKK
jgi:clan AA aspartic protease